MANQANIVQGGIANPMYLVDVNGNPLAGVGGSAVFIADPNTPTQRAAVQVFHNSDNQALPATTYGILTGGVDQLLNGSGNLDRKRSAYADALASTGVEATGNMAWNGASFDRLRTNIDNFVLLASGAVTANSNSFDAVNYNSKGLKLFIKTGAFGSGASAITVTIQGKDPVSNSYYTILTSASLTASTFTVLSVYPGLAVTANVSANDVLPRTWNVTYQASAWGTGGSVLGISCAMIL
jgi:hypothetical protein